ncbi:MAG: hypothetical protein DWQ10_09870 [Calditrichaeota bacterium]|nr:MAG: hypothetical protein DWQ10_09870 [Calditrichota bacterium]
MSTNKENLCDRFDAEIWHVRDRDLSKSALQMWEIHLQNCEYCTTRLQDIESVEKAYAQLPVHDLSQAEVRDHINRATSAVALTRTVPQAVPPLFKKLGAILLPLAAAVMFYLKLNPVDTDVNYGWEPVNYQATISEIDSALAALSDDPLWADVDDSAWDETRADLEYEIEQMSESLKNID